MTIQLGNSLPKPESGWTRKLCIEPNITTFFKGVDGNGEAGNDWFVSSDRYANRKVTTGKPISFKFSGTAFRVLLYGFPPRYNLNINIDGVSYSTRFPSNVPDFYVGFEKLDLPKGIHNIFIDLGSQASNTGYSFTMIGAIDYADLSAKVGDVLKQPEPGWKRFDDRDTNLTYSGEYTVNTNSKDSWKNTLSIITSGSCSFAFYGTKIRLLAFKHFEHAPQGTITIDGVDYAYNQNNIDQNANQVIVFEKFNLELKNHTVTIKNLSDTSKKITLDSIDINDTGELLPIETKKPKVSLYEKESGKIFVDDFDSINPKWLMSPSNEFNNAAKKGFLRMNHSADKDVMLLIDKPQGNFAIQVLADYAPTKEGDEGGLLIYQNEKNKVEFLESYTVNSSQIHKEWMAICKEDQWDFYTKTNTFFDYMDNDLLDAKRIGVVLKRGTAEGFVQLDINKIIMTKSNMLRLRQLYENYKIVLKDTADNILSTNIVAAVHTGIDILLPSLEFEGIIEIYDEENELLAKKQTTFYGGDMYCMGSSLQIKMNKDELNTTDPTNLGNMFNNERIVKMTIVNDNIGAATNIKLSIQQYMEKVGYTWALISLDGTNYLNEIQIDSIAAQSTRDFWVKVVKDTNLLAFEPMYFNVHLKHN
ncbi:hypothetical protein [Bacillus thuringiensis]|uniref:hypothetical protein n=1 Tax=Bacillus thuringiensis TaxID=1428 RepID=UPI001CCC80EB|nr:hypothetical protein [Bacillus thuringiensis]MBZ8124546.1 hypothetical protein [Bacillus thuringiensis]